MIKFDGVSMEYNRNGNVQRVLNNINLEIEDGEFICLIGPSGCGKSTLLSLVSGLNHPTEGEVRIDDNVVTGPGVDRGVVFQHYSLFPWMTAEKNVVFGIKQAKIEKSDKAIKKRAHEFLDKVALSDSKTKYPFELSGGMQQRVALARTLAMDTNILLMDEPFGAIDPRVRFELQELTLDLCKSGKKTTLFVTHDIDEALFLADRILFMCPGNVHKIIDVKSVFPEKKDRTEMLKSKEYKNLHNELVMLFYQDIGNKIGGEEVVI
ncbi:ABC transporter ATP-binding protein [[Clostridium] polysaccharolyticum]|uniref:NitT/TauT family transport system ATP-binding protein n=1 Tax=[Clostridium] polysaccharolyticum TaxID=29364 RepID=A0A1I0BW82_9FIRM|nr:ABC transporter ATP-binding protein [[Clostridium] polysaccharolyticum]SET11262.1 NitT/TauT family transport system ATP-binding protein [[Clostridium] polysaccharolyticum]